MSAPAPATVNAPPLTEADPATPTVPMSRSVQGSGTPVEAVSAVVNDQTGPAVDPAAFRATTCQKYVVPDASGAGAYDATVSPEAVDGGGLVVPSAMSNDVAPDALHARPGVVAMPAATSAGAGETGAEGG